MVNCWPSNTLSIPICTTGIAYLDEKSAFWHRNVGGKTTISLRMLSNISRTSLVVFTLVIHPENTRLALLAACNQNRLKRHFNLQAQHNLLGYNPIWKLVRGEGMIKHFMN